MDDVDKVVARVMAKLNEKIEMMVDAKYAVRMSNKALDISLEAKAKVEALEKSTHNAYFLNPDTFNQSEPQAQDASGEPVMLRDMLEMEGASRPEMHDLDGYEGEDIVQQQRGEQDG